MTILSEKVIYFKEKLALAYQKHEIIKNFASIFSVDVIVKGTNLALIPVYTHLFTQEEFGLYNYLLSILGLFVPFLGFGLHVSQSKIYNETDHDRKKGIYLFTENVTLLLLLAISLPLIYFFKLDLIFAKILFKKEINFLVYRFYFSIAILSGVYYTLLFNFFMNSGAIKRTQVFNLLRLVFTGLLPVCMVYVVRNEHIKVRLAFTYMTDLIICAAFFYYYFKEMIFVFNFKMALRSLKIGIPYILSILPGTVFIFLDKFYLEKKSYVDLSVYYLASTLANIIPTILYSFNNVWMPIFFKEKDLLKNIHRSKRLVINMLLGFGGFSILILIGLKLLLVFGIIGENYSMALPLLPLLLITQLIYIPAAVCYIFIIHIEKTYLFIFINVFLFFVTFMVNRYFIPHYGLWGAALSGLLVSMCSLALYLIIMANIYIIAKRNGIMNTISN